MEKISKFQKYFWLHMPNKKISKAGFTLVELLVALFIFSIGLVSIFSLMINNIKTAEGNKNQIIASELAQEGIELIRNLKDRNLLNSSPFDSACTSACANRRVDVNSAAIDSGNNQLYLNSNFYTHTSSGSPTKFFRRIDLSITGSFTAVPSTREITVTSYVTWNNSGFTSISGFPASCNTGNKCTFSVTKLRDF